MRDFEWIASLEKPILVVGNGVLVSRIPEEEYGSVIRMNNYVLGGLSGGKVTHWVANGFRDIEARPFVPVLVPWTLEVARMRDRYVEDFLSRMDPDVIHLQTVLHLRIWFPTAVRTGKLFPSTGFCLVAWLKSLHIRLDIVGFDGMRTGHQSNPTHKHGHGRTRDKETSILRSWNLKRR